MHRSIFASLRIVIYENSTAVRLTADRQVATIDVRLYRRISDYCFDTHEANSSNVPMFDFGPKAILYHLVILLVLLLLVHTNDEYHIDTKPIKGAG